jgi:hypothetical protein
MTEEMIAAQTGNSRVFLIENRARVDHKPSYESFMRAQAPSKGFGDVTKIEAPDPLNYGKFREIGRIRGEDERASITLEGRYAADLRSTMLRLANKGCAVDIQVHFGVCDPPDQFNTFLKDLILEDALIVNWEADDLGALGSADQAVVNERIEVSAKLIYDIIPLGFGEKAEDIMTNEGIDVVICDDISCGDCTNESDGCQRVYILTKAAGGSPSTPADIVYSIDGGLNWYAHDIDTLAAAEEPNALACVGDYLVVVSTASLSQHYALKEDFKAGVGDPAFTEVATGYVAGKGPRDIFSLGTKAWVVGAGGYVYLLEDATAGVTVQDAGAATVDNLNAIDALSSSFAVAVGNSGTVIYTKNGTTWQAATVRPTGAGVHLNTVLVKSKNEWLVGSAAGRLYYTLDAGESWTEKAFPGSGSGVVQELKKASDSIFYMSHTTSAPKGRLLASFNGGYDWIVLPQDSGVIQDSDRYTAIAACVSDPHLLVATGLDGGGSDGIVIVGEM